MTVLEEGRSRRDEGMALAEGATGAEYDRLLIDQAIGYLAATREFLSANEVRALLPAVRPALMGARFRAARISGLIEPAGTTQATAAPRHANWMTLWRSRVCRPPVHDWPDLARRAYLEGQ